MQLFRLTAVILVVAGISGCRDSTAPAIRTYNLIEIDGQPLPVTFMGVDAGSTIISGTLYLNDAGRALRVDHYRDYSANFGGMTSERTEKLHDDYRIANDSIIVGSFGPCTTRCVNEVGAFSESGLTLTFDVLPRDRPVYRYRLVKPF